MLIQEPVHATIWHCLNHYDYKDATFLAELLYSEVHSDESLHLLATCYYRAGKIGQAYDILQTNGPRSSQSKFLLAKCCHDLNKLAEAEALLVGDDSNIGFGSTCSAAIDKVSTDFGDASAFALQILARIYATTERASRAVDTDKAALQINPFLWSSFEASCNSDSSDVDPHKLFDVERLKNFSKCFGNNPILSYANNEPTSGISNPPLNQNHHSSNIQNHNVNINQNIRHGSTTSTPILPNVNPPHVSDQIANKALCSLKPPVSAVINSTIPSNQENTNQLSSMTTMITPVNPTLFESTLGSNTRHETNDSCFTGSPLSENSGMTGIGQLNFSIDSDAGFTPQPAVNHKEPIVSQQTHQLTVSNQPASISNNVAVTITPSTPLLYTPSPATNQQLSNCAAQIAGVMPPPVLRPKHKKGTVSGSVSTGSGLLNSSEQGQPPMLSSRLNLMSILKGENRNKVNSAFGFLPKGQIKWSSNISHKPNENSPLPSLSLEVSPVLETSERKSQQDITMTPIVAVKSTNEELNIDSSPYAILTPLNRKDISIGVNSSVNMNTDQRQTNKRAGLQTHSFNTSNVQTGIMNSQNITPISQINPSNIVVERNTTPGNVGGSTANIHNTIQSPRRSGRLLSDRNQSSIKSSKENAVNRPVSMLLSPNIGGGLTSSIDRGPSTEGRGLLNTDRVKLTSRNIKSPSRNKTPSNKSSNRLAEKNEKNRQQGRHQIEREPEDKDKQAYHMTHMDLENSQRHLQLSIAEFKEQQKILADQALIIQKASAEGLMELMRVLGAAYLEISRFNNRKGIKVLQEEIGFQHRNSAWVQGLLGKAHFELAEYKEAVRFFSNMRAKNPHRLDFTEYYSTALWHLQEEVELSVLAQELTRVDKTSPQAWCAAGNCFSIQKEHENAIKFFQRAVQVDPSFAYAYTLLGHEYVSIEELDKALSCYRSAVRVDPRHYNAWYGIGLTYYKQERYPLAEIYYRKALAINPQSPILIYHVAVVQHNLQKSEKALETLNTAIKLAPKNPIGKFERASILFSLERYNEALDELNQLKHLVPKESSVFFLIGKVHSKLGNTHLALMHISWAMDLDPKGANSQIKDALDPTLSRAEQEDGLSTNQSALVPSTSPSITAPGDNNSQLINVTQSTAFHADESNIDQSSLITDDAGPSSLHQNSLEMDPPNEVSITRSRGATNLLGDEDNEITRHPISRHTAYHNVESPFLETRRTGSNVTNMATEDTTPDNLNQETNGPNLREDLRASREAEIQTSNRLRSDDDIAETQAADFAMEDLPPLGDSSTTSLQFYQQREEGTLLSPELVTPPTSRIPANITTSTTGTSPIRTLNESASHPFRRLNPDEESSANTRMTNEGQVNSIEHDTRINHASFDLPSMDISQADNDRNSNIGRPGGSDESL